MPSVPTTNIADHIAKLRANKPAVQELSDAIVLWCTPADTSYLPLLKGCVGSSVVKLRNEKILTLSQVQLYCHSNKITKVLTTSVELLTKLLKWDKRAAPSLANYAGSYFSIPSFDKNSQIEIVFMQPLKQLATVTYGKFMAQRVVEKLTKPEKWFKTSTYSGYELITPSTEAEQYANFTTAALICVDVETFKENAVIRCLSYTAAWFTPKGLVTRSVVLAMDSPYNLAVMRKWNTTLPAGKIMQNGKYDAAYFCRYSAPLLNYLYDTANLFHCWYSELPKDLGFLNAFFIREAMYWKDMSETHDLDQYYNYNALDTWGTLNCFLAMIQEAPTYAVDNYLLEFPLTFPCHLSEMTGIERDMSRMSEARSSQQAIIDKAQVSLDIILDVPKGTHFNVMSPPQMKALLKILGCGDLGSTDANDLKKARFRHPLNARIINLVITIRKSRKAVSTYLTAGKEFHSPSGVGNRVLYALNPHGTDSSRLASKEHHFWTGINVQNVPRGPIVKNTFIADPDFYLAEVDLEQAESRDTAYISGDETLIHNVEHSPDFHSANAAAFFAVPFEEIFCVVTGKVLMKDLRTLAKPVNHGANYNMGATVLITTMGEENILLAKKLLGLPVSWGYLTVADYLLDQFHITYPGIRGVFYEGVVNEIMTTGKLESLAVHWSPAISIDRFPELTASMNTEYLQALNETPRWTRHCFGNPAKNKQHKNSYISHPPQSLNAQTLNKAYLYVYNNIAMNPKYAKHFKLCAQIHDSILFQYRIGHEYLCNMVKESMEIPLTIRAYDNKIRSFIVPAGIKKGDHLPQQFAKYWSETE